MYSRASSVTRFVAFSASSARRKTWRISGFFSAETTTTRERDRSGEITSKLGFSVVAPIKIIKPDSTCGRKASCWALLNRWISSTNSTVRTLRFQLVLARSTTASISFLPAVTADSSTKSAAYSCARMRAKVVLPVPGGPQKIRLTGSAFFTISVRILPSPIISSCPITSSRLCGRMRSARGTRFI